MPDLSPSPRGTSLAILDTEVGYDFALELS
jgi:hypothetical protein